MLLQASGHIASHYLSQHNAAIMLLHDLEHRVSHVLAAEAPQHLPTSALRALGGDFLKRFMLHNHCVTEDYQASDHPHTQRRYVARRYGCHRCRRFVHPTPLTINDMAGILALVEPVAEDVVFLGIATIVRCVLADLRPGRKPIPPAAADPPLTSVNAHYELCKARMHDLDGSQRNNRQLTRDMRRKAGDLLATYIHMHPAHCAAVRELFQPLVKRRATQLTLREVITLFDELDLIVGPDLTEEIFLLGCATAARNIIFRLQSPHAPTQRRARLETYYRMLSDIIHARQSQSENRFFHGELFRRRFDTVRWEVINLALAYLPPYAQ